MAQVSASGALWWMPDGGAPRTLVVGLTAAAELRSDGVHLYWVERAEQVVRRVRIPRG